MARIQREAGKSLGSIASRLCLVGCVVVLAGCINHNWTAGPATVGHDFEAESAQCRMRARQGTTEDYYPIREQNRYNECMLLRGWKIAD